MRIGGYLYSALTVILVTTWVTAGCSESEPPPPEELSFEVVDSLLGPSFGDSTLGFAFRPPMGWEQIPEATMEKAQERLEGETGHGDSIAVTPLQFFIDFATGSSCCLSRVNGLDMSGQNPLGEYRSLLKTKFSGATVKEGTFRIDDLNVVQFLITDEERVVFKLLFRGSGGRTFQVDYVVPLSIYPLQIKAIESSIGSYQMFP